MNLRERLLNTDKFKKNVVKIEGEEILIKEISGSIRNHLVSKHKDKNGNVQLSFGSALIIESCYDPSSEEKIFKKTDLESVENLPTSFYDLLLKKVQSVCGFNQDNIEKN